MAQPWAPEAKRKVILAAEAKIDHFAKRKQENPRLARLYEYWMRWYIVRRDDWLTRLYLEQVRAYLQQLHTWTREGNLEQHIRETEVIAKNVDVIEDGLAVIQTELQETLELARERQWKVRYPKPQTTMEGWIGSIHDRYPRIREYIQRIKEALPQAWVDFVYVIYYAYTSPGSERHLEAHLESKCISTKEAKTKVKEIANKILRAFVRAPRVVAGQLKPGYAQPLLRAAMAKSPWEGRIVQGQNLWQWGIQYNSQINYMTSEKRVVSSESTGEIKAFKTVPMRLELFDYDYAQIRSYLEQDVPAKWWTLTLDQLLEILKIEVER